MQRETDDEILETKENDFDEINDLISMTPEEVEKMHSAANEVIDNLPEKDRKIVKEYTRRTELFAGPVPHPEILRQYNEIDPGIADRIIKMAEKDQDHVIECNKKSLELQKRDNFFGMIFAFVIVAGAMVLGAVLLLNDKNIGGYASLITAACAAVMIFFGGKKDKKE